jgi:hypothetical protein
LRSLRTAWREPAYILGFVAIVAMLLYARSFINPSNFAGYWTSTFANASIFLIFSCPVGSASAAIAAARARRAGIWSLPLVRPRAVITLRLLVPSFIAAVVAQLFGLYVLASASWGSPGRIPLEIVLAWVSILTLHISLGYLLGRFLPVAVSIPLSIFFSYCWLGFTWAVSYFPIRYLAGLIITACCGIETDLDGRAVAAVVVFSLLMSVALVLFATVPSAGSHWSTAPFTTAAGIAFGVVAVCVGLNVAQGLAAQPVVPRSRSELICAGRSPTICLYPEQLHDSDPRPVLAKAYDNLRDEGVAVPSVITASNTDEDRAALRVVITPRPTTAQLVYTLSAAVIPDDVAPYCGDGSDYPARLGVAAVAIWWLQKTAGRGLLAESEIAPSAFSDDSAQLVHRFRRLSAESQRSWYLSAAPTLFTCAAKPMGIPAR